jgi:hypothetical protein
MNNDVVIVMEDPVEWEVFTRMHGEDSKIAESKGVVPYFKERPESNARFDEQELRALEVLNVPYETIVVKQSGLTGKGDNRICYHQLSPQIFKSEFFALGSRIRDFLTNIGAANLSISVSGEQVNIDERTRKRILKGRAQAKGGNGVAEYSSQEEFLSEARTKFTISDTSEKTDPDYGFAASCLYGNDFMVQNFGRLLEQVQKNLLHGGKTGKVTIELTSKVKEKCQSAFNAAMTYGLISGDLQGEFEKEQTLWEHRVLTLEYSFELQ